MRTACFVDGYNLFYGLLAGTPYKWLNLRSLLSHITHIENPKSSISSIDYFTSPIKPQLATLGRISKEAQDSYIKALRASNVTVHFGRHQLEPAKAPRFVGRHTPASRQDKVDIWKLEEKETDVHIAISMYRAASRQTACAAHECIEQIVLVSGDTDMTPVLKAVRADFPNVIIGIILPYRADSDRPAPGALKNHSHWIRRVITADELLSHQFPDRVPTHKKPAIKPDYW
ncbi:MULTISPECIES: NYN domain-containing protein [Pseudomonas]|uniref:NYN domain-containing protein n=1 Tax=Pseudomonas koreensis TaxID=198620 RepID=A0A9X3B515_9PSED|nr:NYN domain-containing protein [Pseudomonas botevensis]MBV4476644.1 NYN domain-containing protein [Pseudomonas botevensis]MCU7251086.1 NYN domain-containing protein [Pseudomonas koreensis]